MFKKIFKKNLLKKILKKIFRGGPGLLGSPPEYTLACDDYFFTSRPFLKMAGGIVLGSVAVSTVSADVLLYISVAIKASFLKLGMGNICKNNIAKMFLDFFKMYNCAFDKGF